jgi:hypothetical protein
MEPVKKILFFEKESGMYLGVLGSEELVDGLNKDLIITKEVMMKPNEYWEGDYASGKVYSKNVVPLVFEEDLYDQTYREILESYPLFRQINILVDMLEKNSTIGKTKDFENMIAFINNRKLKLKQKIQHMSSDKKAFNFIKTNNNVSENNSIKSSSN